MKKLTKPEMIEKIKQEHLRLQALIDTLPREELVTPGVIPTPAPGQTVKDLLAHLSAWEVRMVRQVNAILRARTLPVYANTSEFNRKVYEENKDRALDDVLAGFEKSYLDALATIETFSEAELATDGVWQLIGFNTYNHYAWAYKEIETWRRGK